MILKYWLFIILIGLFAYGSAGVLSNTHLIYSDQYWQYYFYWSAPFILALLVVKAWYQTFIWRRMLDARQNPPVLSRGGYQQQRNKLRPSILEHFCAVLFILALAAILKIFSINNIAWWIGSLIFSWLCLRMMLISARNP